MYCINKNSKEFKDLVEQVGYNNAVAYFMSQGYTLETDETSTVIKPGVEELFDSNPELANQVYEALGFKQSNVEEFKGFWSRQQVVSQTNKIFLFGDNTNDRTVTKYVPSMTQAVIRGLPNAIGIDTKRNRGTSTDSYLTDNDFEWFKNHVDTQIQLAKNSGKIIVIPTDGIGTGKAMLKEKAPKLFEYLQQELNKLKGGQQITPQQKQQALQVYSQYLDTIFPDSKVKDIIYHGTNATIETFDKSKVATNTLNYGFYGKGFYFNETKNDLINWWKTLYKKEPNIVTAIIDTKNPYRETSNVIEEITKLGNKKETEKFTNTLLQNKYDSVLPQIPKEEGSSEYVVFEPEQIHILGSKQDIEGFKNFINKPIVNNKGQSKLFQLPSTEGQIASEKTIRELASRMSDRIGIHVRFISDRSQEFKGRITKNLGGWSGIDISSSDIAEINLAYATLDTPIHEILGHPIIRAIKNKNIIKQDEYSIKSFTYKGNNYRTEKDIFGHSYKNDEIIDDSEFDKITKEYLKEGELKSTPLYQNLLKELEYGRGKEVLDRIKRDYSVKSERIGDINDSKKQLFPLKENGYEYKYYYNPKLDKYYREGLGTKEISQEEYLEKAKLANVSYTLEEQQEEAIVELLGLMTAEKLDNVKDGKLISLLKRLLKEMKAFIRSLINQKEVEIDKLPDNMTLGDLSDLLAYSNSKLILPGYEVEYTTPDNMKFKTYQEASNHISRLAKSVENVDLNDVNVKDAYLNNESYEVPEGDEGFADPFGTMEYKTVNKNPIIDFIEKNKEYEQSKEIIEEWKKVNNIQYNPEEVYSRGQEFVSVVGAYSNFDINLMMQNLLSHIEDNEKAGGKFAISAFTKPIDRQIRHLEGGGGKIKFKIYPQSNDILWAANTDVYSGSVWDASEKVNKDKKSELLGVSYTKYPALRNVNSIQPNLASIVDELEHHHNELGITLTGNNFRLEYDDDIPYSTKKIINNINSILDQKYGKLVRPKIERQIKDLTYTALGEYNQEYKNSVVKEFKSKEDAVKWINENKESYKASIGVDLVLGEFWNEGIQPTQTKDTLKENINNVAFRVADLYEEGDTSGGADNYLAPFGSPEFKNKEYTEQALINTKIAKLKEIAKKYPRSLIRSEVKPISGVLIESTPQLFDIDELPFQKIPSSYGRLLQGEEKKEVASALGFNSPKINKKTKRATYSKVDLYNKINHQGRKIFVEFSLVMKNTGPDEYTWKIYDRGTGQTTLPFNIQSTPEKQYTAAEVKRLNDQAEKNKLLWDAHESVVERERLLGINSSGDSVPLATINTQGFLDPILNEERYRAFVEDYNEQFGKNITGYEPFIMSDENEDLPSLGVLKDFFRYLQSMKVPGINLKAFNYSPIIFSPGAIESIENSNLDDSTDPLTGIIEPPKC